MYTVYDEDTGESHGEYETLSQAKGCVEYDKLSHWSIWVEDNYRVEQFITEVDPV